MVTGESMPVSKEPGAKVIAGTLNQSRQLRHARREGRPRHAAGADRAAGRRSAALARADPAARRSGVRLVRPAVIAVAVLAFAAWAMFGPEPRYAYGLVAAVSVLIIACPVCARPCYADVDHGRCRPRRAGRRADQECRGAGADGKGRHAGRRQDRYADRGQAEGVAVVPVPGFDETEVLRLAASVERASEHPLAARSCGRPPANAGSRSRRCTASMRRPARARRHGRAAARRARQCQFLGAFGIDAGALAAEAERRRQDGATVIFLAVDGQLAGILAIADPIKPTAAEALTALRGGLRVVMLTGDNRTTAQAVARRLGIAEVEAEVLPEQKSAVVERLRRAGRVVAMAGDGVNDAPALAAADVGIAMGTGTDVAIETADITLLKGDLTGIVRARRLSQATMRNIRQTCSSPSSTMPPACRSRPACSIPPSACCSRRCSPPPRWRCRRSAWWRMRCGCGGSGSSGSHYVPQQGQHADHDDDDADDFASCDRRSAAC